MTDKFKCSILFVFYFISLLHVMCEQGGDMKIIGVVVRSKIVFVKGGGVVEVGARLQAEHYPRVKFRNFPGSYWEGEITYKVQ